MATATTKAKATASLVTRLDEQPRIIFIGDIRLDPASVLITDEACAEMKKSKAYSEYAKNKLISVESIDLNDEKAVKSALKKIESVQALRNAQELLTGLGFAGFSTPKDIESEDEE